MGCCEPATKIFSKLFSGRKKRKTKTEDEDRFMESKSEGSPEKRIQPWRSHVFLVVRCIPKVLVTMEPCILSIAIAGSVVGFLFVGSIGLLICETCCANSDDSESEDSDPSEVLFV